MGKLGPFFQLPCGCLVPGPPGQGGSPQDDEFAVLDRLLTRLCTFTGRRKEARAFVPGVLEV